MSSLASASRTQPSPASQHVPPPQQRPSDHDASPRPTIIGPESAPEPPFPVRLCGIVEHGFKRGSRELGCPTANLPASLTANPALDRNGVYFGWAAVWLSMPSPQPPVIKPMVMSVGYNPVYGNTSRTIVSSPHTNTHTHTLSLSLSLITLRNWLAQQSLSSSSRCNRRSMSSTRSTRTSMAT
jgi:hypothetical protein